MPGRDKSLGEVDRSEHCSRARLGLVKSIRNGLRKIKNVIESRALRAETGLAGRENGIRFQKEEHTRWNDAFKKL